MENAAELSGRQYESTMCMYIFDYSSCANNLCRDNIELRLAHSSLPPVFHALSSNLWEFFTIHKGMGTTYISKVEAANTKLEMIAWVTHVKLFLLLSLLVADLP